MKKRFIAFVLAIVSGGFLLCSPVQAKTFVGVLWPMFGPLPAIGLVELAGELKLMPDVEVVTYLHQEWPSLVADIARQPPGTRTVVIGYSLGANASTFVANKSKYIDLVIALQPSMLSWNPEVTGKVGKFIEVYNPNPWLTFGGMGSKKLVGPNIEYIANSDSHPGAQFNLEFRNLVKTEIARLSAGSDVEIARAETGPSAKTATGETRVAGLATPPKPAGQDIAQAEIARPAKATDKTADRTAKPVAPDIAHTESGERATAAKLEVAQAAAAAPPETARPEIISKATTQLPQQDAEAFLDSLSRSVNSGDVSTSQRLTVDALLDYARRTRRFSENGSGADGARDSSGRAETAAANNAALDRTAGPPLFGGDITGETLGQLAAR